MPQEDAHHDRLIDLAAALLPRLEASLDRPVAEQIAVWQSYYDECCPDLPPRLYADYERMDGGWRKVAEERIFPNLRAWMPGMKAALANLHDVHGEVCRRTTAVLGVRNCPVVVAYVGLGNGAGWATTWQGQPAVLLGLENIADLGWHRRESLCGLVAHEFGHLLMAEVRGDLGPLTEDPLLALYEEGFAQHCEHVVAGRETWHCSSQDGWLPWCRNHEGELASRYLAALDDREAWRPFFGSWFDVEGWRQTGYYLGCRFVKQAARRHAVIEIAAWPTDRVKREALAFLTALAEPTTEG